MDVHSLGLGLARVAVTMKDDHVAIMTGPAARRKSIRRGNRA